MQRSKSLSTSTTTTTTPPRKRPLSAEPVTALTLLQRQRAADATTSITATTTATTTTAVALLQHPQWKLLPGTLTELAGPAGVGKSQLALTMCADSVVLQRKAVYIVLGGSSSTLGRLSYRLQTMLLARSKVHEQQLKQQQFNNNNDSSSSYQREDDDLHRRIHQWMKQVFLQWIRNAEDLMDFLNTSLPKLLEQTSIKDMENNYKNTSSVRVVILDGIAQLFRQSDDGFSSSCSSSSSTVPKRQYYQHRAATFFQLSNICKQLGTKYQIPFLVLNQATTRIILPNTNPSSDNSNGDDNGNGNNKEQQKSSTTSRLEPALGLAWKQSVNASFFVTASPQANYRTGSSPSTLVRQRRIRCLKAPHVSSQAMLNFYIDQRGTVRIVTNDSH